MCPYRYSSLPSKWKKNLLNDTESLSFLEHVIHGWFSKCYVWIGKETFLELISQLLQGYDSKDIKISSLTFKKEKEIFSMQLSLFFHEGHGKIFYWPRKGTV